MQDSQAKFVAECLKVKSWHFYWRNRKEGEINAQVRVREKKRNKDAFLGLLKTVLNERAGELESALPY